MNIILKYYKDKVQLFGTLRHHNRLLLQVIIQYCKQQQAKITNSKTGQDMTVMTL